MKILETDRLILREIVESDAGFMLDLLNQPTFIKYIGDRDVRTIEQTREYIASRFTKSYVENGFSLYLVELKEDQTPVGICGFVKRETLPDADIGFAFLPQFCGKGYALESAKAMMRFGKEKLNFKRVLAITTQDNESSVKLLEKMGFTFERLIDVNGEKLRLFSADNFN